MNPDVILHIILGIIFAAGGAFLGWLSVVISTFITGISFFTSGDYDTLEERSKRAPWIFGGGILIGLLIFVTAVIFAVNQFVIAASAI